MKTQNRRTVLHLVAGGVAATTGIIPPMAAGTDPVYGLIEAHRKANDAHYAAIRELDRLEKIDGFIDWGITEKPCQQENEAFESLVTAVATTLPGVFAKVDYLRDLAEREAWMFDDREGTAISLIESFVASLKNIGVQP
jgi:hypothetical protein